ncbi:hypothetical protein OCK74_24440 [Chitinophagaceae bacterium LB-8]|uniref:Uncharacterized protein n=1 Tax=Paraflavisolibacter caeni TaxID=2982496 RepID=A0A9X3BA75_9BACT|nr:hypothetical protein [Paraflavisolibacter caeni]MCU7552291.1 hypothetical protein [Paraflavisolibacter caeni]
MINELLNAASFAEVKYKIDATLLKLKDQNILESRIMKFMDDTIMELKSLNQTKLPYQQYANIITAKVHLTELQLQMFNVIN